MTLVIAPHYRWFLEWCRQTGTPRQQVRYLTSARDLLGVTSADIIIVDGDRCGGGKQELIDDALALRDLGCAELRWVRAREAAA